MRTRSIQLLPMLSLALSCTGVEPTLEASRGNALGDELPVCVWIDFDGTLNTIGAFGWPFNPVPAAELCDILAGYGDAVSATPLTARAGCWPSFQPGEGACGVLEPTISVECSAGIDAALLKEAEIRARDADCAHHVLIDDNEATADVEGGEPWLDAVRPTPWDWPGTRAAIRDAIEW